MKADQVHERPRILALMGGSVLFGQERGNIEALSALQKEGCEVLCLIRDEAWSVNMPSALSARGLAWVKVPYIEHRMPGRLHYFLFRNPLAFLLANWRFLQTVRRFRPTHIHACNPLFVLNFLIGLLVYRTPMVYRAGDEPTVHNWAWRLVWRLVYWRTTRFVANSRFVAESLVNEGAARNRIDVIYNSPPKASASVTPALPGALGEQTIYIGYVGQISEHKGVHVLTEAFARLSDKFPAVRLVIAGCISVFGSDAWVRSLRDKIRADYRISARIAFLGETDGVTVLLRRCAVHVVPSLFQDPAPNVVMEAKQAGCPSIVFPRGGLPELVEDGVDGWVCREATVECLVEALQRYLENPVLAQEHGLAALQSLERLGVPQFAQRWLAVYQSASVSNRSAISGCAGPRA